MELNFSGAIVAAAAIFIVGAMHPVIVIAEFYLSSKVWPIFLIAGTAACAGSLFVSNDMASSILCILGFVLFWGIVAIREQERRVERGWSPKNPKRHYKSDELDEKEDEDEEREDEN